MANKKVKLIGEDTLAHFGIPGMKWGVRRQRNDGGGIARKAAGLIVNERGRAAFKRDVASVKSLGSKITNNKFFKAMVYDKGNTTLGVLKKSEVEKGKATLEKIVNSKGFKSLVYNKDNGGFIRKDAAKKDMSSLNKKINEVKDGFNKSQYQSQIKLMEKVKSRGDKTQLRELQDELNDLFTPEEQKRYSS